MTDKTQKITESELTPMALAEAEYFLKETGLEFSKPALRAFQLGVALAGTNATHREFVATDTYREARAAVNPGYAMGGVHRAQSNHQPAPAESKPKPVHRAQSNQQPVNPADVTPADIRRWALENGVDVSERGRISQEVKDAYAAAMKDYAWAIRAAKKAIGTAPKASTKLTAAERRAQRLQATAAATVDKTTKTRGNSRRSRTELQPGETSF